VDDEHTLLLIIGVPPERGVHNRGGAGDGAEPSGDDPEPLVVYTQPYKDPAERTYPFARYQTRTIIQQDIMVWETQRIIQDRTLERLATSDGAVVAMREMMFENLEKVRRGEDPLGVIRDPNHAVIETGVGDLNQTGGETGAGRPYGIKTGTLSEQLPARQRGGHGD
jgi:5,5'-dehydrodivanillate O-demethylase